MSIGICVQPAPWRAAARTILHPIEKRVKKLDKSVSQRPIASNFAIGLGLGATGDVICQVGIEKKNLQEFSFTRLFAFSTFNALYSGLVNYKLFQLYPTLLPSSLKTSFQKGVACSSIDNLIVSPFLYLPAFYLWTGTAQGESFSFSMSRYLDDVPKVMTSLALFWLPLQTINFSMVPVKQRVIFVCSANLIWNCILDFLACSETLEA